MLFYILVGVCYLAQLCVLFVFDFVLFDECFLVMGYDSLNMFVYIQTSKIVIQVDINP